MLDIGGGALARVVQGNDNHDPVWAPDGGRIAFRRANAPISMVTLTIGGARSLTTLAEGSEPGTPHSWSRGGNLLVYTVTGRTTRADIWVRPMDGGAPGAPFLATAQDESEPSISADGRWIAYTSSETGTPEVYVRQYPDHGAEWQISSGGGSSPLWSRDGRELYFVAGTRMMAVAIETRPSFRTGTPRTLFDGGFSNTRAHDFDVGPDGRFVCIRRGGGRAGQELRILLGWDRGSTRTTRSAH
jgi:Tol biopolymer transport system component